MPSDMQAPRSSLSQPLSFHRLCEAGAVEEALEIIERGGPELRLRDWNGWTPLMRLANGASQPGAAPLKNFEIIAAALAPVGDAKALSATSPQATALILAAKAGNVALVKILAPWSDGRTADLSAGNDALMHAAINGRAECVQALLPWSDPLQLNRAMQSALILASIAKSHECVALLSPQSDPCQRDSSGSTALERALQACDDSEASLLTIAALAHGPALASARSHGAECPLQTAIVQGKWKAAALLVPPRPDDLAMESNRGNTPLMLALAQLARMPAPALPQDADLDPQSDLARIADYLASFGEGSGAAPYVATEQSARRDALRLIEGLLPKSNILAVNADGASPAKHAVASRSEHVLAYFAARRNIFEPLRTEPCLASLALAHGDPQALAGLMSFWSDPLPSVDVGGPLAAAILTKNYEWAERILLLPNPILERDQEGFTPLMAAVQNRRADWVQRLLPRSDILALSGQGLSSLALAARLGHVECAKALSTAASRSQGGRAGSPAWICCERSDPACLAAVLGPAGPFIVSDRSPKDQANVHKLVSHASQGGEEPLKCLALMAPFFEPQTLLFAQRTAVSRLSASALLACMPGGPPESPKDCQELFFSACANRSTECAQLLLPFIDPTAVDSLGRDAMMLVASQMNPDDFSDPELLDLARLLAQRSDFEARSYQGLSARDYFSQAAAQCGPGDGASHFFEFFDSLAEQSSLHKLLAEPTSRSRPPRI